MSDNIQTAYVEDTPLRVLDEENSNTDKPDIDAVLKNLSPDIITEYLKRRDSVLDTQEVEGLKYLEALSEDILYNIGLLDYEKHQLFNKLNEIQVEKTNLLREIGIRHKVPHDARWTVNLNEGKIEIKDEPSK